MLKIKEIIGSTNFEINTDNTLVVTWYHVEPYSFYDREYVSIYIYIFFFFGQVLEKKSISVVEKLLFINEYSFLVFLPS